RGLAQKPFQRSIPTTPEIRYRTEPVKMHVDRKRRGRRVIRQLALRSTRLRQGQAFAAEFLGQRQPQIARGSKLLEILLEKSILLVVSRRAPGEPFQHLFSQRSFQCWTHFSFLLCKLLYDASGSSPPAFSSISSDGRLLGLFPRTERQNFRNLVPIKSIPFAVGLEQVP